MDINLFELQITPEITKLYVTDNPSTQQITSEKLFVKASKNSIVSLDPVNISRPLVTGIDDYILWLIREHFFRAVEKSDLFFDVNTRKGNFAILNERLYRDDYVSILRDVTIRFHNLNNKYFLSILPKTGIHNRISLAKLLSTYNFSKDFFINHNKCLVYIERDGVRAWHNGYIKDINGTVKVEVPSFFNGTILVESNRVIPKLKKQDYTFDSAFFQKISKISKEKSSVSSKQLLSIMIEIINKYIQPLFEKPFGNFKIELNNIPLSLDLFKKEDLSALDNQVQYIFKRGVRIYTDSERFKGLSKLNLTDEVETQNVVLFGTHNTIGIIENMVNSLNEGIQSGGFKFDMPSKFGIKLNIVDIYISNDFRQYLEDCKKFIFSVEEKHKNALAIAYLPEHSNLYYEFKAKLAAHGKVSQIRSKSTFDIYTAWNIATNIYAKMGYAPWTITESTQLENADLVLGFSYSSLNVEGRLRRNIGYINVFDKQGEWKFMRSHLGTLDFNNREKIIPEMVQEAIHSYMAGGTSPEIIDIHYSKKFSVSERLKVFESILKILPNIKKVNFISIDDTHTLRIFDQTTRYGNLKRGQIIFLRENEFILSVLGNDNVPNAFRQMKVIVHTEGEKPSIENNLAIGQRILAMTKLNWRSVIKDSSEPVTLKYSSEIAKLTNQFSLTDWNIVSSNLSKIPWFI